jgi:putative membrane protein insertion efficiency factor
MSRAAWWVGSPFRLLILAALGVYRGTVGQLASGRCRFHPTCSAYAIEAVRTHGALKGSALAAWRVLRCSPLTAGGIDPVPPDRSERQRVTPSYAPEGSEASRTASYIEATG